MMGKRLERRTGRGTSQYYLCTAGYLKWQRYACTNMNKVEHTLAAVPQQYLEGVMDS